jgi:hypothetical protein
MPLFVTDAYDSARCPSVNQSAIATVLTDVLKGHDFSRAGRATESCWALQAAEKLDSEGGGGFNPRIKPAESTRSLAPEEGFSGDSLIVPPFSAACKAGI